MTTNTDWTTKKILITVRTYPTPATKGVEVSCTAGITEQGEWIRLFPIPYRFLDTDKRFRKYQFIEARVKRASDPRPESYNVDLDSIRILSDPLDTNHKWQERKDRVFPLRSSSLCELQRKQQENGQPTLGFFKPREVKFNMRPEDNPEWTQSEREKLSQMSLLEKTPAEPLEKVPYKFHYEFRCLDSLCNQHSLLCTDWEMGQSYRKWRDMYGPDNWRNAFKKKYEVDLLLNKDLHFYVGTVHLYPNSWIIVGLFYPPQAPERLPGFC